MTKLPEWNGMDAIFMVVNQLSKLAKMAPIKKIGTTFDSIWGSSIMSQNSSSFYEMIKY
jgi:hypothetical protein